ncbi:polysaccharide pyruvyl transferase family protein [Hyphomicrobium album]|uniref:polysaccharide pyruvyl transferase family protein n=1 Tax=Hyphomicrobium album TaxID=2665159 RepID=UPI0018AA753C|nr:polysaccharide pyruvyl transferase family protein [Hyphomicrobium album]
MHLASFAGNIGDVANHAGARRMLGEHLDFALEYTELEIREFYWTKRPFDDAFVDYANTFDLLLIGGGNYFELWVERSATGTSIDISPQCLARLKVPTLFFAIGVDIGQGYSKATAQRFDDFISEVLARSDMFVCVRNDGSSKALCEVLGAARAQTIPVLPDGGFFAVPSPDVAAERPASRRIGINIAGDMLERRFNAELSAGEFLKELASACTTLLDADPTLGIDLRAHIWRDVALLAELMSLLPDRYLRRRIFVGQLVPSREGLDDFLDSYGAFDLVLGMRFHANVCPLGMGVPARGLLNYPQVALLYEELEMTDRLVDVRHPGCGVAIADAVVADLANLAPLRRRCLSLRAGLDAQACDTLASINTWLHAGLR